MTTETTNLRLSRTGKRPVALPKGVTATVGADKIEIKVGVRNDREQEITSGVAESDEVVIRPPSAAANEFK